MLLILSSLEANAQWGYWWKDIFMELIPDSSSNYNFVKAMDDESLKTLNDLLAGKNFRLAKQLNDEVERMNKQIKECIALWIGSREVMKVITDKPLLAQSFPKDLHCWGVAFLQSDHGDRRSVKPLKVDEHIEFFKSLAGRFLDEERLSAL